MQQHFAAPPGTDLMPEPGDYSSEEEWRRAQDAADLREGRLYLAGKKLGIDTEFSTVLARLALLQDEIDLHRRLSPEEAARNPFRVSAKVRQMVRLRYARRRRVAVSKATRTTPRPRGAGRPRAQAARRSSTSRDDGDPDPPGEPTAGLPPAAADAARRILDRAARRLLDEQIAVAA